MDLTTRDKVITELRLRLPASAERDRVIDRVTASVSGSATLPARPEVYDSSQQAYKVAQSTVHSLQVRFCQLEMFRLVTITPLCVAARPTKIWHQIIPELVKPF